MSSKKEGAALVGVGVAACAVCCAGPILGVLAAIGLGTALGVAMWGLGALVVGVALAGFMLARRGRRAASCSSVDTEPVAVELSERARR
ncbi:MAG TPA: hypothetical protein VHQ23_05975 [Ilumatobacteraceae bacterium]|nr:hypothetical protein [Ilumatobacteraceae bacterium]